MKAAWYERTGPPEEVFILGQKPVPRPGPGEVLVRVEASGINPADVKLRSGWLGRTLDFPFVVPHNDGAGVITEVGPDVDRSRVGERVWLWARLHDRQWGTAARYVALPAAQAVPLPEAMSFAEGACLGGPAVTAFQALFWNGGIAGETVLVAGGAGGVGYYAVQFALYAGARVIATVGTEENARVVRAAGIDHVLDYRSGNLAERILEIAGPRGVDRIVEVDFAANITLDAKVVRPGGVIVSYSSTSNRMPRFPYYELAPKGPVLYVLQAHFPPVGDHRKMLSEMLDVLAAGKFHHRIHGQFPLEDIARAHRLVEQHENRGKVVLTLA